MKELLKEFFSGLRERVTGRPQLQAGLSEKEYETRPSETLVREFELEIVEPITAGHYTGTVVSNHGTYCFIGNVRRGFETINTNGDVFCPQSLPEGVLVEFNNLSSDSSRTDTFRTELATVVGNVANLPQRRQAEIAEIIRVNGLRTAYHATAKTFTPEQVQQAAANNPFEEMLIGRMLYERDPDPPQMLEYARLFLSSQFSSIVSTPLSCDITNFDEATEDNLIEELKKSYRLSGLNGQIESIATQYRYFKGIRRMFASLYKNGLLTIESVIPDKYLPDLLLAAPVWFIDGKGVTSQVDSSNPPVDESTVHFCNRVGSRNFAWLYQIYNQNTRIFASFAGRDVVPPKVLETYNQVKGFFDYVVIATPYHDLAPWHNENWRRNIDPFMIGFCKDLPFMFLLGRWSANGLLPQICDMIADTVSHLRVHGNKLERINSGAEWYLGEYDRDEQEDDEFIDSERYRLEDDDDDEDAMNNVLVDFVENLLTEYDKGAVFEFLRAKK